MSWTRLPARNSPEEIDRLCRQWQKWAMKEMQTFMIRLPLDIVNMAGGLIEFEGAANYALYNTARLYEEGRISKRTGREVTSMGTPLSFAVRRQCQLLVDDVMKSPYEIPHWFSERVDGDGAGRIPEPPAPKVEKQDDPRLEVVEKYMEELDFSEHWFMRLYYFNGLNYSQIGEKLGTSKTTIQTTVRTAIKKMHLLLGVRAPDDLPRLRKRRSRAK